MTEPFRTLFVVFAGAWTGVLVVGILAISLLMRRLGKEPAWPAVRVLAPVVDLAGTWAGSLAALALLLGRSGYGFFWATALLLIALMLTASLYDRAVLLPSLDAAWKRLGAGTETERWEGEWRFLWRMAAWGRAGTLAAGFGALACGLLA